MKAALLGVAAWTPERGVVSAEDGLGALSRFSRSVVWLVERLCMPDERRPVILGTRTGATEPPSVIAEELGARWPGAHVSMVAAGTKTVPLSFLDATMALRTADEVVWLVAELQAGAELAGAFVLGRPRPGVVLSLARSHGPPKQPGAHLNPCAPILQLEAQQPVSLSFGSWLLTLSTEL